MPYFKKRTLIVFIFLYLLIIPVVSWYCADAFVKRKNVYDIYEEIIAINLAEAGIEEAMWELNYGHADFQKQEGWGVSSSGDKRKSDSVYSSQKELVGEYDVFVNEQKGQGFEVSSTGFFPSRLDPTLVRNVVVILDKDQTQGQASRFRVVSWQYL